MGFSPDYDIRKRRRGPATAGFYSKAVRKENRSKGRSPGTVETWSAVVMGSTALYIANRDKESNESFCKYRSTVMRSAKSLARVPWLMQLDLTLEFFVR